MTTHMDDLSLLKDIVSKLPLAPGEEVVVESLLSGGVVSVVGKGHFLKDGERIPVAIKHTKKEIALNDKFSPLESRNILKYAASTQHVDAQILTHLQSNPHTQVPKVISYYEKERVTVLRDFGADGYTLFQDAIVAGNRLQPHTFVQIGVMLANLRKEMVAMKHIEGVENRELQIEERTDELRVSLYNGRMGFYNKIWHALLDEKKSTFTWTDGHPKNMAINKKGDVVIFDFGRSIWCDPEYPVANFIGQIYLFALTGSIKPQEAISFSEELVRSYKKTYAILTSSEDVLNERNLVWYLTAELAHRGKTMRWIDPKLVKLDETRVKSAVDHLVDIVFDRKNPVETLADFEHKFLQIAKHLHDKEETYLRPSISSLNS